mgnify:CR=1 FL=1
MIQSIGSQNIYAYQSFGMGHPAKSASPSIELGSENVFLNHGNSNPFVETLKSNEKISDRIQSMGLILG